MQRNVILVLGMHRSGTSALTRTLNLLGCDLPRNLVPETPTNPTGHWEPNAIMALNNEILSSAGSNWYDWLEFNPRWYDSPVAEGFSVRARGILREEYDGSSLFVLKDPRNCRLTRFWFDILDQSDIEPLVAIPLRNPLEVAASLEARDDMHRDLGILLWLRHVLDAEQGSRGRRRIFFSYVDLLENWAGLADHMQQIFGITWPRSPVQASADVEAFLDRDNRHYVQSTNNVLSNPALSDWVRNTYDILIRWASQGEVADDRAVLDDIRAQLNAAGPVFAQLTRAVSSERDQGRALHVALQARESELAQMETDIAALRDRQHRDAQQVQGQVADYESRIAQLEGQREKLESTNLTLAGELDSVRQRARVDEAVRQRDAISRAAQIEQQAQQLAQQRQEGEALKRQLAEAMALAKRDREKGEAAEEALRTALIDNAVQEALLAADRDRMKQQEAENIELRASLQARDTMLVQLQADKATLRTAQSRDVQQAQAQAADYARRIAQLEGQREKLENINATLAGELNDLREQARVNEEVRQHSAISHAAQVEQQRQEGEALKREREAGEAQSAASAARVAQLEDRCRKLEAEKAVRTKEMAFLRADVAEVEAARERDAQLREGLAHELADHVHELASVRSSLRQRDEEIFQTLAQLEEARRRADEAEAKQAAAERRHEGVEDRLRANNDWVFRLAGERRAAEEQLATTQTALDLVSKRLADFEDRQSHVFAERDRLLQHVEALESGHAALRAQGQAATQRWHDAQSEAVRLNRAVQQRDAELTDLRAARAQDAAERGEQVRALTKQLKEKEAEAGHHDRQVQWLQKVSAVMTAYPQWWTFMPKKWRQQRQQQRLMRQGLFDADAYLARYPDVLSSGMDPLRHYLIHGMGEKRII